MTIDELTQDTIVQAKTEKFVLFKRTEDPLLKLREYLLGKGNSSSEGLNEYLKSSLPTAPYD